MKAPFGYHDYEKDISGCGVFGVIHRKQGLIKGDMPIKAMCTMHDRGNGLGGGFAAYGIYPHQADKYAFHVMAQTRDQLDKVEADLKAHFDVREAEEIPVRKTPAIKNAPLTWRYFCTVKRDKLANPDNESHERQYVVDFVMRTHRTYGKAVTIFSSGKNMGAFKGIGFPEDIAEYFRLDEYAAYIWTGHNRFPTNTPGAWGGAHPFTLLDWSIVHNGEISSYDINRRYLLEHDYICTLETDTEVVAYLLDMLVRKHGLSKAMAAKVLAPPFWDEIDRMPEEQKKAYKALRMVYGSGMLNGPFAILVGQTGSLMGLNDRIKLRPLVVGEKDDMTFMSSEESSILEVSPVDRVWMPKAGEPVIVNVEA